MLKETAELGYKPRELAPGRGLLVCVNAGKQGRVGKFTQGDLCSDRRQSGVGRDKGGGNA